MLTNLLHQLLRHGLVTSTMGSKGGYRLAKRPEEISVAELINAIEGPFKLTACCSEENQDDGQNCGLASNCRIKGSVWKVHESLRQFLGKVTLAHIAFDTVPVQVGSEPNFSRDCAAGNAEPAAPESGRAADLTTNVSLGVPANVDCTD
jgi:Rrf2 family protein